MKALFLTADLGGNVPPTVAVATALSRRDCDVAIAGLLPNRIALPQIPFGPATAINPEDHARGLHELGSLARLMAGRSTSRAVGSLIARQKPDVVVVDCMLPAVLHGAFGSGTPVVVLFHTLGEFWRSFDLNPMGLVPTLAGMQPSGLWSQAKARLLLTDRELDPGSNHTALAGFSWTGTTEIGAEPAAHSTRPRVLVALSSSAFPGMLPIYRRIIAALAGLPVDATVTTGGVDLGGQLTGAPNVEVHEYVPHHELLPSVDLLIGHGGHSTTLKALAHGVPLLVLPINPTADQRLIGKTLQGAGVGRCLARLATPAAIREAATALLGDQQLRARAASTGRRLRSLPPGAEVAADQVLGAANRGT